MLYAIISEDVPNSLSKRLAARPAHLVRLQDLQDAGRLIIDNSTFYLFPDFYKMSLA